MAADAHNRPNWDEAWAAKLIGAVVLIGITRVLADGNEQEQMFGVVTLADPEQGFQVMLSGSRAGEIYWLPPDIRNFSPAAPGDYRLRSTGETVTNPDYISTWTISGPTN